MTAPISSGASPHDLAPSGLFSGYLGNHSTGGTTATELARQSPTDTTFLASDQFRKIQSTAQQALAQCMELGLHVLPIHRAEQRDLLAAKLLEAAYEGVGGASTSRNLGPALPRLTALVHLVATHGADLQHQSSVQQPEGHTMNCSGTGISRGSSSMQIMDTWHRDRSNNMPEGTSLWQNSPTGATEATNSRKRQSEEYPGDVMGSQTKRQQTEIGPELPVSAQLAVSSMAPTSNVASLMTNLEQEVSQDLAQWSETRSAGILDGISTKIEGANAELGRRAAAAAEAGQSAAQAAAEQQAQAAALAKIEAINSRLAQAGVAPHVVPAAAPSIADALAAKFAAANASFMQAQPGLPLPAALPAGPATAAAAAAMPPEAAIDAAKLAALDAKLAQFQQAVPPASGGPASAADRTSNLALLDAKLARYGSAPAAPELAANSLYQPTLQAPNMGYAPHLAAAPFSANGTGVLPGAGVLGASRPILSSGPSSWPGALGGQSTGTQLSWQPAVGAQQAHLGAMPGVSPMPMGSMPRGNAQNGLGMHQLGAPAPSTYRSAPGAAPGLRPMNGPDVKARLQQEALARLQQVNKGWK